MKEYKSLKEFYPYYLSEHQNPVCRALHFVGTTASLGLLLYFVIQAQYEWLWLCVICGYGFAWVGHFFFEKNRPATFKYPTYSFLSDFILWFDLIRGKEKINPKTSPAN